MEVSYMKKKFRRPSSDSSETDGAENGRPPRVPQHLMSRRRTREAWLSQPRFCDPRTEPITKRSFSLLMRDGGIDEEAIERHFHLDLARDWSEKDADLIRSVSERILESLRLVGAKNKEATLEFNVSEFEKKNWITRDNLHSSFVTVITHAFSDGQMNWGRFISFMLVSASFAAYTIRQGMHGAVESVQAWTEQTISEKLAPLFLEQGSWEGFIKYADVTIESLKKKNGQQQQQQQPSFVSSVATAVGAVGLGALVAFSLRQVLS